MIKEYASRGPLRQYRFEQATPFVCFRCGKSKKSKLLTVYEDDWSRLLCNGCYGRLLSIYEIGKGSGEDEERARALSELLPQLLSTDEKRRAEARLEFGRDPRAHLCDRSMMVLGTSQVIADRLSTAELLEWSPAIIGLCKAVEIEVARLVLDPLRDELSSMNLSADVAIPESGRSLRAYDRRRFQ